ncbi:tetratricopeptide repeat containing protein [Entamoeba histolytica HM-1:IMSS-B]|uniref:Small glutamine-rich tetratricopeptide repeat-containing protein n=5 Tax=Entamoeba histolytica TaxID=5759 RepID=C4LV51_ENTH1|nr:hypothetical protein, conserved [Entamoeba histolytica HM-1:IMSS]EMD45054.1 Ras GTPase-activating protein, putative [Entamoeba histolytica KU27]EMH72309.1 tetratricopeptide repeat containing protein [Entamoeba histolytica HM-1:IMSS-B]ENY63614.1 small glutamine-rich tetratricopeptide repeat-containing protein [Entamoeba histolytica HM-1:IMSS-A]GAT92532.1 hypothetical protein conserved [Entamoeba histolytica]EAL43029.1 hypothetical protein, conserved [Entamoeba histolytica HM-1:IMSS]|eukprot:XP_648410.1 hypothetical protein, conserved [Entamoeba histolytica HM-1:IMSS]
MEVPTKEQVFEKYMKLLEKKGYLKDVPEEEKEEKVNKAKKYFEEHYNSLERFPAVKIPKTNEEVTEEKKNEAESHKAKGNDLFTKKDYATAICEYSRAIECDPFNHIYYSNRSACYCYLNNDELAVRDGEKCVELCPTFAKGYSRLSAALMKMGKLQEAKEAIDKALSIEPENQNYLNSKMDILDELSKVGVKEEVKEKPKEETTETQNQPRQEPNQQQGGFASLLNNLMSNPAIQQMAQSMMSNPAMMNMAQSMMNNPAMMNMAQNMMSGQGSMSDLLNNPQLRHMAQQMANTQQQQSEENKPNQNEEI